MPSVHVFIFVFGAIIGSFLNVVIFRYNTGFSIFNGRSRCLACGKDLKWFELLPILSFLIQRGRCRKCGSKISLQYPLVEATTGLLFLLIFIKFHDFWLLTIGYWLLVSLLIVIAVYDIRHKIIPNLFVWLFNLLAFLFIFFENWNLGFVWKLEIGNWELIIWKIIAGFGFAAFFVLLWAVSRGRWMGFGDAKLALGLGWLLGAEKTILAFLFSFWLGGLFGIALLLFRGKKYTMKSQISFGPFLAAGSLLALFLNIPLLNLFIYG